MKRKGTGIAAKNGCGGDTGERVRMGGWEWERMKGQP